MRNRERLQLLGRIDQIRFDDEMRGYAAVAVRDLITEVADHVPALQEAAETLETSGRIPDGPEIRKAVDFLASLSTISLPLSYRGYNRSQVDKIIAVVKEFAGEFGQAIEQPLIAQRSSENARRTRHELRPLLQLDDVHFGREFLGYSTDAVDRHIASLLEHVPNLEFGLDHLNSHDELPEDDAFVRSMSELEAANAVELPRSLVGYDMRQVRRRLRAVTMIPGEIRLSSSRLRR